MLKCFSFWLCCKKKEIVDMTQPLLGGDKSDYDRLKGDIDFIYEDIENHARESRNRYMTILRKIEMLEEEFVRLENTLHINDDVNAELEMKLKQVIEKMSERDQPASLGEDHMLAL